MELPKVPIALFGIVAFIMVFTYTSVAIIYGDYSQLGGVSEINSSQYSEILHINDYMNLQWRYTYSVLIEGESMSETTLKPWFSNIFFVFVNTEYRDNPNVFDEYKNGYDWYQHSDILNGDNWISKFRSTLTEEWREQLEGAGYESEKDTGFFGTIMDFFGTLPDGYNKMMSLITFNIQTPSGEAVMPDSVRLILNIVFIPLWIILIIGIAPIVAEFIKAVATIIDAVVPF